MGKPEEKSLKTLEMMVLARMAPVLVIAAFAFARRTQPFHILYLRLALRRPFEKQLKVYSRGASDSFGMASMGNWVTNPVLSNWLKDVLESSQRRVLHVVAGDSLLGKSSTALRHVVEQGRRGVFLDLLSAQHPGEIREAILQGIIAQSGILWQVFSPVNLDLRATLPLAARPLRLPFTKVSPEKPVIILNSAQNLFRKDKDGNDASWLLWVLIEASRHAQVLVLCSDEAAQMHLSAQNLAPFLEIMFCPEPPHQTVAAIYTRRCPESWPLERRQLLGRRMADLWRRSPQLGNDMLRLMQHGRKPATAALMVLEQAAESVAERLRLSRPSAFVSPDTAEDVLLGVEACLIFALSPSGRRAKAALVQAHDPAPKSLMQNGLLRIETGPDGSRNLRLAQDAAIVWCFSDPRPRSVITTLQNVLLQSNANERYQPLVSRLEDLLARCLTARSLLLEWVAQHMNGEGPDEAEDWRRLVDVTCSPAEPVATH